MNQPIIHEPPSRASRRGDGSPVRRQWSSVGDADLVRAVGRGDADAFAELHRRYRPVLGRYAARILGEGHGAREDVLQDVFQRTHSALTRARTRPLLLRPWLFRLTYNRCIDELRAGRRLEPIPDELERPADSLDPLLGEISTRLALRQTIADIASLPPRQRAALVGVVLEGRTHEELAAELRTTVNASKGLVSRARGGLLELRAARAAADRAAAPRAGLAA